MVLAGCTVIIVGLVGLIAQAHAHGTATGVAWVTAAAAVMSAGNGLVLPALIGAALADVTPQRAGAGAGLLNTAQQFAASTGVALVGTIYFAAATSRPGPAGYTTAMTRTAIIDLILILTVAISVYLAMRRCLLGGGCQRPGSRSLSGQSEEQRQEVLVARSSSRRRARLAGPGGYVLGQGHADAVGRVPLEGARAHAGVAGRCSR